MSPLRRSVLKFMAGVESMKVYWSVAFSLLFGAGLWGQSAPNSAPIPQPNQAAQQAGMQPRPLPPADANASRMQFSRQFALELEQMRAKLDEMKTNDAKIKDPAVRKHLQLDTELWDLMYLRMNEVTSALMQMKSRPPGLNPAAAQMYRRQMLMGAGPATAPAPVHPAPAQSQPAASTPAPSPSQP